MPATRTITVAALVALAVVLQISLFPHVTATGVVPDVVLVLVVAVALAEGPRYAAQVGLGAGLLLDLAPPADHTMGRWALTFVVVGYLAGLVRQDARRSVVTASVVAAACAFVGTSLFALSGIILEDAGATVAAALSVIPLAVLYDVVLALAVVPAVRALLTRLEPVRARW